MLLHNSPTPTLFLLVGVGLVLLLLLMVMVVVLAVIVVVIVVMMIAVLPTKRSDKLSSSIEVLNQEADLVVTRGKHSMMVR